MTTSPTQTDALAYDLHVLVARLDAAADRILRATHHTTYRRFLALLAVRDLGPTTQRALARRLDVSDPSASRMVAVLADESLVSVAPDPAGGNRRRLTLTARGRELTQSCAASLEGRFTEVVSRAGVPYQSYAGHTRALVECLTAGSP